MRPEHASDRALSDVLDGCSSPDDRAFVDEHVLRCAACADRRRGFEAVIALGALERSMTRSAPDQWSLIAACTVHEAKLRRVFAQRGRSRLRSWIVGGILVGALLAEGVREVALMVARAGGWAAAKAAAVAPPVGRP